MINELTGQTSMKVWLFDGHGGPNAMVPWMVISGNSNILKNLRQE
jgi:hypothetical protein